jgi:hypothetical protein
VNEYRTLTCKQCNYLSSHSCSTKHSVDPYINKIIDNLDKSKCERLSLQKSLFLDSSGIKVPSLCRNALCLFLSNKITFTVLLFRHLKPVNSSMTGSPTLGICFKVQSIQDSCLFWVQTGLYRIPVYSGFRQVYTGFLFILYMMSSESFFLLIQLNIYFHLLLQAKIITMGINVYHVPVHVSPLFNYLRN